MHTFIAQFLTINAHITSVLCVVPNLLVVFLILTTQLSEIHEYRLIMAIESILELITCLTLSLLDLGFYEDGDVIYFVQKGILASSGQFLALYGWVFVIFLFSCKMFLVLLVFIFRYAFICDKHYLKSLFTCRGACVVAVFVTVVSATIGITSGCTLRIEDQERFDFIFMRNDTLTFFFKKGYTIAGTLCATTAGAIFILTYTVVFWTSARIIRKTKASGALLPQIFIIMPILFLFGVMLTPVHIGIYASVVPILFNWEPCAYPFIALYFVQPFRKRLSSIFSPNTFRSAILRCCCSPQQSSTTT
ncbi:unnamed protein product [Anisakis simplex]|uniref:G protein-coupled receptor n=1 Tax=Anisakis simplex TaxID=6269 RepID=A0A0M3K1N7_ANISI|nr:unnamed protein product [Anisakis simplex]